MCRELGAMEFAAMLRLAIVQSISDLCDIVRDFGYGVFFLVPMSNLDWVLSAGWSPARGGEKCCFMFPMVKNEHLF